MKNIEQIRDIVSAAARIPDLITRIAEERRISRLYPHAAMVWFNLASDLAVAGLTDECRDAALRAVDLDPLMRDRMPDGVKKLLITLQPTVVQAAATLHKDVPPGDQRSWDREDLSNRVLAKWRLGRLLGEGGFGRVYEAEHVDVPGHRAAVKILRLAAAVRLEHQQRFINEMSIASRSQHENVVQIFDGGITEEGVCYAAMELLRGQALSNALAQGPLSAARTVHVGLQVASALHAVHQLGVVHRDLKPDNIFLTPRESDPEFVKVLDFGIAKLRDPGATHLTTAGTVIGTPGYMAPEQWRMEPDIDGRADIYALGVILYQCIAGRLPFLGATTFEFQQAHLQSEIPPFPSSLALPAELVALVRSMLAKQRAERPQDMEAVRARLRSIRAMLDDAGAAEVAQQPPKSGKPARRTPSRPLMGGALLIAITAAGFAFWPRRAVPPPPAVISEGEPAAVRARPVFDEARPAVKPAPEQPIRPSGPQGTRCAEEGRRCEFSGTATVYYGARESWVKRQFTDGVDCNNETFGDPIGGVVKECWVLGGSALTDAPLTVLSATYGANCGASSGNVTGPVAATCAGRPACDYRIDHNVIGDPAKGCAKDFLVRYRCPDGTTRQVSASREASGKTVALRCSAAPPPARPEGTR